MEASATSFGPFPITRQIDETQYIVRGRIGNTWVKLDEATKRPYTYWNLNIVESYSASKLDGQVAIRQPGGEVGNMGYRIPGSAEFQEGEDVVVMLREAGDGTKEVTGLMSGKYTVFKQSDGREALRNGLGIDIMDSEGKAMTPDAFHALVERVNSHSATDADRKLMVNPAFAVHREHGEQTVANSSAPITAAAGSTAADKNTPIDANFPAANALEKSASKTDRHIASQTESSWIGFFVGGMFLICAALMYRLLTRKPEV